MARANDFRKKALYILAGLMLFGFVGFAIFKANRVAEVYYMGSQSIQLKIGEAVTKVRTGEIELTGERLAVLLEASADRTLEDGIVRWFRAYLILFIILFGASTLFFLYREAVKTNSTGSHRIEHE